jgi:hypothetical protein
VTANKENDTMTNDEPKRHPYEPGTPLAVFFDAASTEDFAWLRDWEAEVEFRSPDPAKFGSQVQLDGDFDIAAGIRAVMALAWDEGAVAAVIEETTYADMPNPYR